MPNINDKLSHFRHRLCRKFLLSGVLCVLFVPAAFALDGNWRGELRIGPGRLPLVFHFTPDAGGRLGCTLDSPQQGARGIPAVVDHVSDDSLAVSVPTLGATFRGHIGATSIDGVFAQRGYTFALTLERELSLAERRPQTPQPPFPYTSTDTTFASFDGARLSATLVLPPEAQTSPCPLVVLVSGSGPQNRDEEIFENRPFAVLADFLARHGIATLRYDDRGTGRSQGDFATSTTFTFRDDAAAALRFARSLDGVGRVGILGHSEGGTIAFMLAADGQPDFIVSLAGMTVSSRETLLAQNRRLLQQSGMADEEIGASMRILGAVFDEILRQHAAGERLDIDFETISRQLGVEAPAPLLASLRRSLAQRNDYFDTLLLLDISADLARVGCPVLALGGTLDTQVDARRNLAAVREALPEAEVHEMDGLNHLFQHAATGDAAEYGTIRETLAPEVLALVGDFVLRQR